MSTIITFLLFIGVITAPEQATQTMKDSYKVQYEEYRILNEDIGGW